MLPDVVTILKFVGGVAGGSLIAFLASYYWWSADRDAEKFDSRCRETVNKDPAFRGLKRNPDRLIITSDTRTSRAVTTFKKIKDDLTGKPHQIVPIDGESRAERKKRVLLERCKEIPGKNILDADLVACLRNFYAYKLALKEEGVDSETTHHFKKKIESHKFAGRVQYLSDSENYGEITLLDCVSSEKNALDDVFLPLLRGAERYCIKPYSDVEKQRQEIGRCREFIMYTFWGMYQGDLVGMDITEDIERDECVQLYRRDVRDGDRVGYWLLGEECEKQEFDEFKNIAWKIEDILDEYWNDGNFSELYPNAESIPQMDYVSLPFVIFQKDLDEFSSGPKRTRIKGDERYRRKEHHKSDESPRAS